MMMKGRRLSPDAATKPKIMSRPDTADCLGLTIESNLVNTDIPGSLRRNRSAELAAHCAAQLLRTERLNEPRSRGHRPNLSG